MNSLSAVLFVISAIIFGLYLFNTNALKKANKVIDIQKRKIDFLEAQHTIIINQLSLNMNRISEVEKILTLIIASGGAINSDQIIH